MDYKDINKQAWEKIIEEVIVGIVLFIGLVSLLYSWIDSLFGVIVGIPILTFLGILASFIVVYAIRVFDKG
ncbi:MAG: hypothetical protein BJBARM4_0757 [Candidatus Parvarchaeum acidiphilum ARMAN-4]|jgi:hypothetical protein|uniref:Uncharacterized protein n=2 Tax=Parvarchaeum acidiphilum TaxID=662759 RepID=D2EG64_PARA4|nr:MAG: hypothetical protein BJBARM4_0757 [Candidatus Parvarchaeum acidiphilum ARMAN-4]EGD71846.1 MAG: hypothetical protein CSMARM4_0013 [Candidatus Parvarchaeum acidiphilum ARMAN-4_'5-way FS']